MTTPAADKTAKRISIEDWFVRYDAADLMKHLAPEARGRVRQLQPPADRVAVRA